MSLPPSPGKDAPHSAIAAWLEDALQLPPGVTIVDAVKQGGPNPLPITLTFSNAVKVTITRTKGVKVAGAPADITAMAQALFNIAEVFRLADIP